MEQLIEWMQSEIVDEAKRRFHSVGHEYGIYNEEQRIACIEGFIERHQWVIQSLSAKAKELQAQEIVSDMTEANQKMGLYGKERWAVVDSVEDVHDNEGDAKRKAEWYNSQQDLEKNRTFTIVKIIKP